MIDILLLDRILSLTTETILDKTSCGTAADYFFSMTIKKGDEGELTMRIKVQQIR